MFRLSRTKNNGGKMTEETDMNNVVMPEAFANRIDPERAAQVSQQKFSVNMDELRKQGVIVHDAAHMDAAELPEPAYGEQVLGTLTDDEALLFSSFLSVKEELDEFLRGLSGTNLERMAQAVRSKTERELMEQDPLTDEQYSRLSKLQRQKDYLRAAFYWIMCDKYNCHEYNVGVRSKRRFIKSSRRSLYDIVPVHFGG
jgi:hypothetical protein